MLVVFMIYVSLFQFVLVLCNAIGTPLDSRYIDIGMVIGDLHLFSIG